MLTRRHIRVKVIQSLYAMKQRDSDQIDVEVKFLKNSYQQVRSLFIVNLGILGAIRDYSESVMEINRQKRLATKLDKKPNRKFVENPVLKILQENKELCDLTERLELDYWKLDSEYINILHKELIESDFYKEYLESEEDTFSHHRKFIVQVFKDIIVENEKLYDYLTDKCISWTDDIPLINTYVVNYLNKIKEDQDDEKPLPRLVKDKSDLEFGVDLLRKAKLHEVKLDEAISDKTPNWDKERLDVLDRLIITSGICEFWYFPSIPTKVTINEWIEVAKDYSSPKSKIFINGVLDKISKEGIESGQINKIGRGLL